MYMIIIDRDIVQVDTVEVEKLFQWLNRVVNVKLIQAGRDLNKGKDWSDIAYDISQYVNEITSTMIHQICERQYTSDEISEMLKDLKDPAAEAYYYPVKEEVITPPPPKPREKIAAKSNEEVAGFCVGEIVEFIKDRSEPIGTAGRAWATLPEKWYTFFKDCDYKYIACPNNNYWWIVADITTTKRGKKLYALMTSRDEKEKLWCLADPTDIKSAITI